MRTSIFATLGVASIFALGCTDTRSASPTDPDNLLRFAKTSPTGPCSSGLSKAAKTELTLILARPLLKPAQNLWTDVERACDATNPDAANEALFAYLGNVRPLYPSSVIQSATRESIFLGHLNTVFSYVGYPAPGLSGGATGPLQAGIVAVIPATGGIREYQRIHLGAFELLEQGAAGDQRGHLFVMSAMNEQCLSVDNLRELEDCVELTSYPGVTPKFSPKIKVGICFPENVSAGALVLGHETPTGTEIAGQAAYPVDCHASLNVASTATGFEKLMTRLASFGRNTIGVRRAYASDKGLGGIGSFLSPWGALDALIFGTNFNAPHVVGSAPDSTEGSFTFTQFVTSPGSILIQNGLGNLTGQLVVLSQGGGACASCGGLELRGHFFSASGDAADDGVYEINWTSVQTAPGVKGAPFVLRASDTAEVARVTYDTQQSVNRILYNGVVVGSWTRNVGQHFKIVVNLNTNKTSLYIGTTLVATEKDFVNPNAQNIASLAAEFSGIDSGVMGWDALGVQRISDQPAS